jgi:hypothetical protein
MASFILENLEVRNSPWKIPLLSGGANLVTASNSRE